MTTHNEYERLATQAAITAGVCEGCPVTDHVVERFRNKDRLQRRLGAQPVALTAEDTQYLEAIYDAGATRQANVGGMACRPLCELGLQLLHDPGALDGLDD